MKNRTKKREESEDLDPSMKFIGRLNLAMSQAADDQVGAEVVLRALCSFAGQTIFQVLPKDMQGDGIDHASTIISRTITILNDGDEEDVQAAYDRAVISQDELQRLRNRKLDEER